MIHIKPDLFEMTPADHERMRAIARRQVQARIEHIATPVAPQQQATAAIEDEMIERMTGDAKRTGSGDGVMKWNQIKQADAQTKILAAMDSPKTALQIAHAVNKSDTNVVKILNRLRDEGRVTSVKQGRKVAAIWSRTEHAYAPPDEMKSRSEMKGEQTRKKALDAMTHPMTASDIAKAIGRHHTHTLEVMRKLMKSGHVTRYKVKGQHGYVFERVVSE